MDRIFAWQAPYFAAICETDDSLIGGRILEAQAALEQRLLSPIDRDGEEGKALKRAEKGLEALRSERTTHAHRSKEQVQSEGEAPSA
jgi:hypothetical protein